MENRKITYVTYITTTPEKLWEAITSAEALKKNWGRIESQWTAGSRVTEVDDSGTVLWQGEVFQSERHRLLSYSMAASGTPTTQVKFELSQPETEVARNLPVVCLTVTQEGFRTEDNDLYAACSRAWPEIVCSFKTYLETGRPIGFAWKH